MTTNQKYGLAPTELFELLANTRRRYVLHYLTQHGEAGTLDDLAAQLVQWERDATESSPDDHRARIAISLIHIHLPKLEDAGVLRYDPAQKTLKLCEPATALQPYLNRSADADLS